MITIKDKDAQNKMMMAGRLLNLLFIELKERIVAGVSTLALDRWIDENLAAKNLVSQSKGYKGYRHASCISINDEVVHGIPRVDRLLKDGDTVKIDVCASWSGYCADKAQTFYVGDKPSEKTARFIATAVRALENGIAQAVSGGRLGDIGAAVQQTVEKEGFGVIRNFAGHGIGKHMHEEPEILNFGKAGTGVLLRPGMALAIEPMITYGHYDVYVDSDGWTAKTVDGSLAAHVEETVIVGENGPHIITRLL